MSLDGYTDQQLMDELLNRRTERELADVPRQYCEDCRHFTPWTKPPTRRQPDVPDDYNPCALGHQMAFHMPEAWEDPHDGGYFRRVCSDRAEIPPPPKPKAVPTPPEPPRGQPGWKPRTV